MGGAYGVMDLINEPKVSSVLTEKTAKFRFLDEVLKEAGVKSLI